MRLGVCALVFALAASDEAGAQDTLTQASRDPDAPTVTATVRDLTRVESWSFFDPSTPFQSVADGDYTFVGNRLTFGVTAEGRRWQAVGALQYIQLWNLPATAFAPGPMGTGALYYVGALQSRAYQLYPRLLNVTWKNALPGTAIIVGRQGYASGGEATSNVPALEVLKRERLDERLIGEFDWSIVERAFDGVRVDVDRRGWHASGALLFPTQGAYEESATPTITDVQVAAASVSFKPDVVLPRSEVQGFVDVYRDRRSVEARPDNSARPAQAVNVTVTTIGGSQVGIFPTAAGELDTLVWATGQVGDWYGQRHRAFSVATEIGHRFTAVAWRPWIRVGWLYASGDDDPADDRHGTFFQMLPNVRRYSQSTTYSLMNLRDFFVQAYLDPQPKLRLRADLHRVDLASGRDRWYTGSGATARTGPYFGYASRPAGGETSLGTVLEASAELRLQRHWSVNGYVGRMWGGDVVRQSFAGDRLTFFYLENVIAF